MTKVLSSFISSVVPIQDTRVPRSPFVRHLHPEDLQYVQDHADQKISVELGAPQDDQQIIHVDLAFALKGA